MKPKGNELLLSSQIKDFFFSVPFRLYLYSLLIGFAGYGGSPAYGFPEIVRHGYTNCTACHVSPSGGGVLTPYGRSLSKELLTFQWKKPKANGENNTDKQISPWHFGGEVRALQFHRENEYEKVERFIPMQAQGEVAYLNESYAAVGRLGVYGKSSGQEGLGIQVPTVYGLYRFQETWTVRGGLFLPAYGLNNSMHYLGTRGGLGFGFDDQRPTIELAWLGESMGAIGSVFGQRGSELGDTGGSLQLQYSPTDKSKIAINYWYEGSLRNIVGFWFVTPLYANFYLAGDFNLQNESDYDASGAYYYSKLGYEIRQGLNAMFLYDHSQRDIDRDYTLIDRLGPGLQFYPYSYLELELAWLQETNKLYSKEQGDYVYALVHAYF